MTHNSASLRRFRDHLRHQQRLLERSMSSAAEQGRQTVTDDTQDQADQAVLSYQKELLFSQGTTGHRQLSQVMLALERLEDGSFGQCIECGNTIGQKRLEALPWTPYCIDCQEKIENGQMNAQAA